MGRPVVSATNPLPDYAPHVRPLPLRVVPEVIPDELKAGPCFVAWDYEYRPSNSKPWTKPPVNVHADCHADVTDPDSWATFDEVAAVLDEHDGIGRVFTEGDDYFVLDADDAGDERGNRRPWAIDLQAQFAPLTYIEASPSGNGFHVIGRGKLPPGAHHKIAMPGGGNLELYDSKRYMTLTGARWPGCKHEIGDCQDALDQLYAELFPRSRSESRPTPPPAGATPELDDYELIRRATAAQNGPKVTALLNGTTTGYPSASEAVIALLDCLVFWTQDTAQLDRLVRGSGLDREKWDSPRGDTTWGQQQIASALRFVHTHYTGGCRTATEPNWPYSDDDPDPAAEPPDSDTVPQAGDDAAPWRRQIARLEAELRRAREGEDHWRGVAHERGHTLAGIRKLAQSPIDPRRRWAILETLLVLDDRRRGGLTDNDGGTYLPRATIAERVHVGPKVVSDSYDILDAEGVVKRENVATRDGAHKVTKLTPLKPLGEALFAAATIEGHESHQGGARIPVRCPSCGRTDDLVYRRAIVCTQCEVTALTLPDRPLPPAFQFDPVADDDDSDSVAASRPDLPGVHLNLDDDDDTATEPVWNGSGRTRATATEHPPACGHTPTLGGSVAQGVSP